tara:strand:- start:1017 stop:1322 length:306 start_codon:yes stop_codon:yes gene_type:complete
MAKKSKIVKNLKKIQTVDKYRDKRNSLKAILSDPNKSFDEKMEARLRLEKLPRDSIGIRVRNRCNQTGRPRAYYRRFGLSRISLREMALKGYIPGLRKASW